MSKFRNTELYSMQGKETVNLGGRLRVGHETWSDKLSVSTKLVQHSDIETIVRAAVVTPKGIFTAHGKADPKTDAGMRDSLIELAESRAVGRSLRYAGIGVEFTGAEEMGRNRYEGSPDPTHTPRTGSAALDALKNKDDARTSTVGTINGTLGGAIDLVNRLNPVQRTILWRRVGIEAPRAISDLPAEGINRVIEEARKLVG